MQLKFRTSRFKFSLGQWHKASSYSALILWSLFRKAIWGMIGAILLIIALRIFEHYIPLGQLITPESNQIGTYGVLAQISGLILGLYFTAMSVVVSTVYSKVPESIRNLIAREKVGDKYIDILMLLGTTSLIELGLILQGQAPSSVVLYVALFMALMALLTLPILVHNIFHFFDPARLAETYIFPEAIDWARKATCGYHGWNNPAFQYHYYKQTNQRLSTYKSIVSLLVKDSNPNNVSLTRLVAMELSFLSQYAIIKSQIPTDSRWYQYQAEHPKWFEVSSSSIEMAMHANISLPHQDIPNHLWVEERVATNFRTVLSHLLEDNDLEHAVELIQHLQSSCTKILKVLALKEAYYLTSVCDELIVEYLSKIKVNDENKMYQIALADFYGANHVNIPIEYGKILDEVSPDSLKKKLRLISWESSASAYKAYLPVSILPSIEDLLQRKQNQTIVDPSIDIPEWYDLELVSIACLKFLHEAVREVVEHYEQAFTAKIEAIEKNSSKLIIMQILTRGLEGYSKCSTFLSMAKKLDMGLLDLIIVKDIPHSTLDWSEFETRVESVRSKIIERFGSFALSIDSKSIDKSIPDYTGHAYWLLARECFNALCEQNEDRYKSAYSTYILLKDQTRGYFLSALANGGDTRYYMSCFSEIFVDAMAIGGYAKLFNEFREGNYWQITTDIWDAYLKACDQDNKDLLGTFLAMAKYKSQPLISGLTNRSLERTGWEQKYNRIVRNEVGLSEEDGYLGLGRIERDARDQVESALLRT